MPRFLGRALTGGIAAAAAAAVAKLRLRAARRGRGCGGAGSHQGGRRSRSLRCGARPRAVPQSLTRALEGARDRAAAGDAELKCAPRTRPPSGRSSPPRKSPAPHTPCHAALTLRLIYERTGRGVRVCSRHRSPAPGGVQSASYRRSVGARPQPGCLPGALRALGAETSAAGCACEDTRFDSSACRSSFERSAPKGHPVSVWRHSGPCEHRRGVGAQYCTAPVKFLGPPGRHPGCARNRLSHRSTRSARSRHPPGTAPVERYFADARRSRSGRCRGFHPQVGRMVEQQPASSRWRSRLGRGGGHQHRQWP